ncbi:MAG TPA: HAMP domain-containing sensor histidine kinase [Aggregatilineaceae bacterium]|nr:HAMP domain-containing sensor histidine kinase [Aggregatilineaceae bacterium]
MSVAMPPDSSRSEEQGALQPTVEELCQNARLLIRLRWVAGFGILFSTGIASLVLGIDLQVLPLVLIGLIVLGYNALLSSSACKDGKENLGRIQRITWGQILLDWLAMIALVHFTGGITSPALIYFVIHAALSGTILLPWQARGLTVLAIGIVGGLVWLERLSWLPHIEIAELGMGNGLYRNTTYIGAVMFFFGSTILTLSELVTHIAQRLRQREERIRQLYEARATFVRVATHELRAPLAAGLSLMKNIEQGYAGELTEQQVALMQRITSRLEGLRMLIDDLLTLAMSREISAAQVPLEPASVRSVLERIIERELPQAEQKRIVLHRQITDQPGIVMGDEVGLQVILGNLLNNAIKYSPDGGQVTVGCKVSRSSQTVDVTIADTGIGIPAHDLPNIFNEFFRAQNAKDLQIIGTGIGLTTVHTLIERFHGTIDVQSEEGKGTTVTVSLPLAPRQVTAEGQ